MCVGVHPVAHPHLSSMGRTQQLRRVKAAVRRGLLAVLLCLVLEPMQAQPVATPVPSPASVSPALIAPSPSATPAPPGTAPSTPPPSTPIVPLVPVSEPGTSTLTSMPLEARISQLELKARRFAVVLPPASVGFDSGTEVPLKLESGMDCLAKSAASLPNTPVTLTVDSSVGSSGCDALFTELTLKGRVRLELPRWLLMPPLDVLVKPESAAGAAPDPRWALWCQSNTAPRKKAFVYCVDLIHEEVNTPSRQPRYMGPEQELVVVVRYVKGPIQVNVDGATGIYRPEVDDRAYTPASGADLGMLTDDLERVALYTFPALLPGRVGVQVVSGSDERHFELWVERQYAGALRVGVAFPTLEAVNRRYEAYRPTGSESAQIIEVGTSAVDVELVAGYKHYLRPVLESDTGGHPGIFFGMGVFRGSDGSTSILKSYYLGVDFGNPYFSVGVAACLRETDRLAAGLEVGDAITDVTDIRLDSAYRFGVALIISPAPDLLKLKW